MSAQKWPHILSVTLKKSGKQYFLRDWHISQYLQYFWETFLSTIFAIFLRDISEHISPKFNWADTSPWICWNGCPFNLIFTWVLIENSFLYKIHCSGVYSFGMHRTRFNPGLFYKLLTTSVDIWIHPFTLSDLKILKFW